MRPADDIRKSIENLKLRASANLDERVYDDISRALAKSEESASAHTGPTLWRIIMKSHMTKLSAAAAIIIAVIAGVFYFGGSTGGVAIADIVEPFLTARTATFKVTISGEGMPAQEFDGMFMEPCRMRQTQPGGGTVIADLQQGKIVTLIPQAKQAVVVEAVNIPEDPGSLNFFQEIRNRILKAEPFDDESVEFLGEQELDGQLAIGYHIQKPGLHATVWAHAETKMPVRIEVLDAPMTVAMSNIVFDVALDETLFSLDIPDGYTVKRLRQDLSEPTEEDLVASFRMWAEHMGGTFPSKMDRSAVNEFVKYQQEKMKEEGIEPSSDRMTQLQQTVIDMSHGFPFVEALPAESDWHYAGRDVEFGDAGTPIFWYRPQGAVTYRVIYGDLSVLDVPPEDLPK